MPKVQAFHTTTPEEPAVYHDNSVCADGKRIKQENKVTGTGGRRRCDECNTLAAEGQ
jgi:hypothetical protein